MGTRYNHLTMFLSRNKKNNVYACKPQFYYINVGFKGGQNYTCIGTFSLCENVISTKILCFQNFSESFLPHFSHDIKHCVRTWLMSQKANTLLLGTGFRTTCYLTRFSLETPKKVNGKQFRPRSDATQCGIYSGSPLFANSLAIGL